LAGRLLQQRLNKLARIETNRRGDVQKLQHIKTPIPTLVFRHVGWRFTEALCHYRLGQTSCLPPRFEQFTQLFVAGGVDGLWQLGKPESVGLPIKNVLDDSPKMGENGETEVHPLNTFRGTSGGEFMINLKILAVGLAAACLAGCAVQRAVVANDAQEKKVGLTKEQVLACMGVARHESGRRRYRGLVLQFRQRPYHGEHFRPQYDECVHIWRFRQRLDAEFGRRNRKPPLL
jgi:hypothetical protein